jgi:uncharacterized delta-60 repeat protein
MALTPYRSDTRKYRTLFHRRFSRPVVEVLETRALLSAGFLDPSFGAGGGTTTHFAGTDTDFPAVVLVQPQDSKILVGGAARITAAPTTPSFALARFNPDGSLDMTFGHGGQVLPVFSGIFGSMILQPDGKIVVAGTGPPFGGSFLVARLNADGSPDSSFGQGGLVQTDWNHMLGDTVVGVVLQGDKIIVAGVSGEGMSINASFLDLARYNPDGSLDQSFGTGGKESILGGTVQAIAIQSDGKLVCAGTLDPHIARSSYTVWYVSRLNHDGTTDTTFGANGSATVDLGAGTSGAYSLAIASDGRIVTAGFSGASQALARLNPDGSLDTSFGIYGKLVTATNGKQLATTTGCLALQRDNSVLVAGPVSTTSPNSLLFRYRPDGSLDARFGTAGQADVPLVTCPTGGIAVQADGGIVVAGTSGGTDFAVVRYLGGPGLLPPGTPSQQFVSQVYLDLLGRTADAAGLALWSGLLDQGSATRTQIAQSIEVSPEFQERVVSQLYEQYLQRALDPIGAADWTRFLAGGGTIDQLRAQILGSDEYAALQLATSPSLPYVQAVYHDVLLRTPDPAGLDAWNQALNNGASHLAVASGIVGSVEGFTDEVEGLYHHFLHRAADPAGQEAMVNALRGGESTEALIAALVGSNEYFLVATPPDGTRPK